MEIDKLQKKELSKVQELAKRCIRESYIDFLSQETIEMYINSGEVDHEISKHEKDCYVLKEQNNIIAYIIFLDDFIHIMMIDPNFQRNGYGSQLLAFAEFSMLAKGFPVLKLETFMENKRAMTFYQKNNWQIIKQKREEELGVTRVFLQKKY
jgi:ribosomal protein S18 acetylase RimI-like enzyme